MVDWNELEKVTREGDLVKSEEKGHEMIKVYRLDDNGNRRKDRAKLNLIEDKSIPKEEREKVTAWKCTNCGVEIKGAASSVPAECPEQ